LTVVGAYPGFVGGGGHRFILGTSSALSFGTVSDSCISRKRTTLALSSVTDHVGTESWFAGKSSAFLYTTDLTKVKSPLLSIVEALGSQV
jgi:hypothetical protein